MIFVIAELVFIGESSLGKRSNSYSFHKLNTHSTTRGCLAARIISPNIYILYACLCGKEAKRMLEGDIFTQGSWNCVGKPNRYPIYSGHFWVNVRVRHWVNSPSGRIKWACGVLSVYHTWPVILLGSVVSLISRSEKWEILMFKTSEWEKENYVDSTVN